MTTAILASGIHKSFGTVQANLDASLEVEEGEIHAVVGENGAGKSTLMRILAGMYPPDSGRVEVMGREVTGWTTREAIMAGVGMVHQHFMLVPTLTVAENLVLGLEPRRGIRLDRAAAERAVRDLAAQTGLSIDPARRVDGLSVGEAQRVEILKVLFRGARILILDEPTAVLSPPEVRDFWKVLRSLSANGGTVVLITHKLDEVMEISNTVTVMRGGRTVGRLKTAEASPSSIARMMVGRDVRLAGEAFPDSVDKAIHHDVALSVSRLTVASARRPDEVHDLSLEVREGEILGIAGVEGNGQTELAEAIAGLRSSFLGTIKLGGQDITELSVRERAEGGLSHIPEDRHHRGLVLDYSTADNLILGLHHRFSRTFHLDFEAIAANAHGRITQFDIRPPDPAARVRNLSGGNQQKVVIAREMEGREFSVLLAVQPTRGVDVGAIEFIHAQLRKARDNRRAILLISADLGEILALSDRIAVMYGGRVVALLGRAEATAELLGDYMTGAAARGAAGQTGGHT